MKKSTQHKVTADSVDVEPKSSEGLQDTEVKEKQPGRNRTIMFVLLALAIIPLVLAVVNYKTIIGMAASVRCQKIQKVAINPGAITTTTKASPTFMSTLAYDVNGKPITKGVVYEWGISSNNSIGTVKARRDLGAFYPKNVGTGDLYVQAKKAKITGSIKVVVQSGTTASPTRIPPRKK